MPRPIKGPNGPAGIATYQVGNNEEFALLAVTFSSIPIGGPDDVKMSYFDMRDAAGGIIYMQPLGPADQEPVCYCLAVGASEFSIGADSPPYLPQYQSDNKFGRVTQRLSPQTLYSGCTINAYSTTEVVQAPDDPIDFVSTSAQIADLHLWVEDVNASVYVPPEPLPPILVHAPELVEV